MTTDVTNSGPLVLQGFPLGTRLVVRYRIDGTGPNGQTLTDALGLLVRRSEVDCEIRTRKGDVTIMLTTVVAVKQVPPAPPRRDRSTR